MTEKQKKGLFTVIAVVCVAMMGFVIFKSVTPEDKFSGFSGQSMWVVCVNPSCGKAYETDKRSYYEEMENKGPYHMGMQGVKCQYCSQLTAFEAIKCPKCGNVFRPGSAGREDFHDRCPKCLFSESEEKSK